MWLMGFHVSALESYPYQLTKCLGPADTCFGLSTVLEMTYSGCFRALARSKARYCSTPCSSVDKYLNSGGVPPALHFLKVKTGKEKVRVWGRADKSKIRHWSLFAHGCLQIVVGCGPVVFATRFWKLFPTELSKRYTVTVCGLMATTEKNYLRLTPIYMADRPTQSQRKKISKQYAVSGTLESSIEMLLVSSLGVLKLLVSGVH